MGTSSSTSDGTGGPWSVPNRSDKGNIADVSIDDLRYAGLAAGAAPDGRLAVRMTPASAGCCDCWAVIPDSFVGVKTNTCSGQTVTAEPGCHYVCGLLGDKIDALFPKHVLVYTPEAQRGNTKDNIEVSMSVSVTLKLEDNINAVTLNNELFTSGDASEISAKMTASINDSVRGLLIGLEWKSLYDLQGKDMQDQKEKLENTLNRTVSQTKYFSVLSFVIQEIILPAANATSLQQEVFEVANRAGLDKQKEKEDLRLKNDQEVSRITISADNDQLAARNEAEKTREEISRRTDGISNQTREEMAKMNAEKVEKEAELINTAELKVADLNAEADAIKREMETEVAAKVNELNAQGREYALSKETELLNRVATDRAESQQLVAQSEADSQESQMRFRKYEQDKAQLDVFSKLVDNRKLRIASSSEVNARGMTFNDDRAMQFVHAGLRAFHAKFTSSEIPPQQEPLLS